MTRPGLHRWKPYISIAGWCVLLTLGMLAIVLALSVYQGYAVLQQLRAAGAQVRTSTSAPAWMRDSLDGDPLLDFGAPVEVDAAGARLSNTLLQSFLARVEVAELERLSLLGTGIRDDGLEDLSRAGRLEFLNLSSTRITNKGLEHVGCLSSLRHLVLSGTRIDDEGLKQLRGLRNLRWLELGDTRITDAGLESLTAFPRLEALFLTGTRVSDDGVHLLTRMQGLEMLCLAETLITDEALKHLSELPRLSALWLNGTRITDDGLKHLSGMTGLKILVLHGSTVSGDGLRCLQCEAPLVIFLDHRQADSDGAAALRQACPKCRIRVEDWAPESGRRAPPETSACARIKAS